MNQFLMGGRVNPESLCLVMEDATTEALPFISNPLTPVNTAIAKTLRATRDRIKQTGMVSRNDLVMLDSHFPEAIKNLPLNVWTAIPSTTGVDLAMEGFAKALVDVDKMNAAPALQYVIDSLTVEIDKYKEFSTIYHAAVEKGKENCQKAVTNITELNRIGDNISDALNAIFNKYLTEGGSDSDEQSVVDKFRLSRNGFTRHMTERGADVRVLDVNALMAASFAILDRIQGIANTAAQLKAGDVPAWDEEINRHVERGESIASIPNLSELPFSNLGTDATAERYIARATELEQPQEYDYPNGFMQAVRDYHEFTLPALYASMEKAEEFIIGRINQLEEVKANLESYHSVLFEDAVAAGAQKFFLNGNGQSVDTRFEHLATVMRDLAVAQRNRMGLFDFFCSEFTSLVHHGICMYDMLIECVSEARELALESFWPKLEAEVEAADGYTTEGAWEAFRRALGYLVNFLEKISNWLINSIDVGVAKSRIARASSNSVKLSKVSGDVFDERHRKRLERQWTVGIRDLSKYAGLGNIWSDNFRQLNLGLQGPVAQLNDLFAAASRGEELSDEKVTQLREALKGVLDKSTYKRLPDISNDLDLSNVATRVAEVRAKINEAFKEQVGGIPDIGALKTATDNVKKFLEGPAMTMYKMVNGGEFKNLITKLNSMERQTVANPNNKALGKLVEFIDSIRNLIQAATTMLGICNQIAIETGRFSDDVARMLDKVDEKPSGEVIGQDYKAESFNDEPLDNALLERLPSVYQAFSAQLGYGGFTATRADRLEAYAVAINGAVNAIAAAQARRESAQEQLRGIELTELQDVPEWSLGLDVASTMDVWYNALSVALDSYINNPAEPGAAITVLNPEVVAANTDPNLEVDGSWYVFYDRLAKEAVESHTDFTDAQERVALLKKFINAEAPFGPTGIAMAPIDRDMSNIETITPRTVDLIQQFAQLFVCCADAYIQLTYGSDSILLKAAIANKQ